MQRATQACWKLYIVSFCVEWNVVIKRKLVYLLISSYFKPARRVLDGWRGEGPYGGHGPPPPPILHCLVTWFQLHVRRTGSDAAAAVNDACGMRVNRQWLVCGYLMQLSQATAADVVVFQIRAAVHEMMRPLSPNWVVSTTALAATARLPVTLAIL